MTETWVFDVDGCLIDSLSGSSLRPGAADLLVLLRARGCRVLLWSAGGAGYAAERATEHGLEGSVDGFHSKTRQDPSGPYDVDGLSPTSSTLTFVDDRPEDLAADADVIAVSPYLSHNPHDRAWTWWRHAPAPPRDPRSSRAAAPPGEPKGAKVEYPQ